MGLGKTIQTIALIASTMTSDEKTTKEEGEEPKLSESVDDHKVTLIVTPLSLIHQWEDEIRTKTDLGKMKVMIHHGGNRTKDPSVFANYDVVITTYQVVSSDLPNPDKKKRSINNENSGGSGADTPDSDGTATSAVASPIPSFTDNETTQTRIHVPSLGKIPKPNPVNNGIPGPILQFKWHRVVLGK
jgi:SNF2 family DNA or RNA helicase